MTQERKEFMQEAIRLAEEGLRSGRGGPFGCVVVRQGKIVARGCNGVLATNDPTAHAEVMAIREAGRTLGTFRLNDCELYTNCEPCPMCLAAIYWAHIPQVYFANTRADAAAIGFDDAFIAAQISLPSEKRTVKMRPLLRAAALPVFQAWTEKSDKIRY